MTPPYERDEPEERDELATYDRAELEALRDLHEGARDQGRRDRYKIASAISFAVAGGSLAVMAGTGALGVLIVAGVIGGIYSFVRSTE